MECCIDEEVIDHTPSSRVFRVVVVVVVVAHTLSSPCTHPFFHIPSKNPFLILFISPLSHPPFLIPSFAPSLSQPLFLSPPLTHSSSHIHPLSHPVSSSLSYLSHPLIPPSLSHPSHPPPCFSPLLFSFDTGYGSTRPMAVPGALPIQPRPRPRPPLSRTRLHPHLRRPLRPRQPPTPSLGCGGEGGSVDP